MIEQFERYISHTQTIQDLESFWDSNSEAFFNRTEREVNFKNRFVLQIIKDRHLLTEHSAVLDIGCGTGRHLLEFAHYTPYVTGVDISSKILVYAQEKLRHIPHAQLIHGNWLDIFTEDKQFDFVFACMTPAVSSIAHLKRMSELSKKYCMLERFVYQKDGIEAQIEKIVGTPVFNLQHNKKEYLYGAWNIVWHLQYLPELFFDTEEVPVEKTMDTYMKAVQSYPEKNDSVYAFLQTQAVNGSIKTNERIVRAVLLWDVSCAERM